MTSRLVTAVVALLALAVVPAGHADRRAGSVSCDIPATPDTRTGVPLKLQCASTADEALDFTLLQAPAHGQASRGVPGSQYWYTPTNGFQGSDSFQFKVVGRDSAAEQTYSVGVAVDEAVDHAPVCLPTPNPDNGIPDVRQGTTYPLKARCGDDESDPFTASIETAPATGTVTVGTATTLQGTTFEAMRYAAPGGASAGTVSWTFKVTETGAHSKASGTATATVHIPGSATNTEPDCNLFPTGAGVGDGSDFDPVRIEPGQTATLKVACTDGENDDIGVPHAVSGPANGSVGGAINASDRRFATLTITASGTAQPPTMPTDPGLPDAFDLQVPDVPPAPTIAKHYDTTVHIAIVNHTQPPGTTPTPTATATTAPTATATATATPTVVVSDPTVTPTPTATPAPLLTLAQAQAVLGTQVTPAVLATLNDAIRTALKGGSPTVTINVGPFDAQVTIDLQLLLGAAQRRAAIAKTKRVARGRLDLAKGATGKLKLKLTKKAARQLKKKGRLKLTAKLTLTNTATGATAAKSRSVTLKYAKKHA